MTNQFLIAKKNNTTIRNNSSEMAFKGKRERVTSLDAIPSCGSPLSNGDKLTKAGASPALTR